MLHGSRRHGQANRRRPYVRTTATQGPLLKRLKAMKDDAKLEPRLYEWADALTLACTRLAPSYTTGGGMHGLNLPGQPRVPDRSPRRLPAARLVVP